MKTLIDFLIPTIVIFIIIFINTFISGWMQLALHYRTKESPPDILYTWQTGTIGVVSFKSILNIGVAEQGIYLSAVFFLHPFYPPLLIPWDAITQVWSDSFGRYKMDVGTPKITRLSLPKNVLQAAETILATKQQNFGNS